MRKFIIMTDRQKELLRSIIKAHIKQAGPIGSHHLVNKYKLDLSPATIRGEMVLLEEEGFLFQPHTSSGRLPTEKAYRFYVENLMQEKGASTDIKSAFQESLKNKDKRVAVKKLAKNLAEVSHETIVVGFTPYDLYYTGLSNLFSKPEFQDIEIIYEISAIIDHLDEVVHQVFDEVGENTKILIGRENPFSADCSAILTKNSKIGLLGLIGPIRMDYDTNVALIKCVKELI